MHDLVGGKSPEDLLRYLNGAEFPIKKDDLVRLARRNAAPDDVVAALSALPRTDIASQQELIDLYPHLV